MTTQTREHLPAERSETSEAAERSRRRVAARTAAKRTRAYTTAPRAIAIAFLAMAFGSLLIAQSVRRNAEIQSEGWQRTVGMALTKPLASVSSTLGIDEPRHELRQALGREDEPTNVTVLFTHHPVVRTHPRAKAAKARHHKHAKPAAPPPKPAFNPHHPLRIWIAGDSLSITPGWMLVRTADRTHVIDAVGSKVDGQVATGLERPDVYNWFRHIPEEVEKVHPNAVVLTFGANDDHDLMTGVPKGRHIGPFGSASWIREYRRRVAGLMDEVTRHGALLVWIGLPIARDSGTSEHFRLLNRIYRSEAEKFAPKVAFVDTYSLFENGSRHFSEYLTQPDGTVVKMRTGDGVHYEDPGGQLIAWHVMREFNRAFDLHSWQRHR